MRNIFFSSKQILTFVPIIALVVLVVMLVTSMSMYSGGTRSDFNASGYTFSENYISDLGRYVSVNGQDNKNVMLIFILSFFILGSSFFLFFYHNYYFIKRKFQPALNIFRLATFFALCSTVSIIGVGLTPSDINFDDHVMFAEWIFRFFFGASVLYAISYYKIHPKRQLVFPLYPYFQACLKLQSSQHFFFQLQLHTYQQFLSRYLLEENLQLFLMILCLLG